MDEVERIMREHNVSRATAVYVAAGVNKVEEAKADCCRHRHNSGCISEYVCPKCKTVWRRDKKGEWVKRQNPYTNRMPDPVEPEDWELPMDKWDEPWNAIPGQ